MAQEREREPARSSVDSGMLARNALKPIEKKLNGVHMMNKERLEKEESTSTLVQIIIQEAADNANVVSSFAFERELCWTIAGKNVSRPGTLELGRL